MPDHWIPALHYVLVGEERGLKPSPAFDPVYYAERYPDVAAWGGNRLRPLSGVGPGTREKVSSHGRRAGVPTRRIQTG